MTPHRKNPLRLRRLAILGICNRQSTPLRSHNPLLDVPNSIAPSLTGLGFFDLWTHSQHEETWLVDKKPTLLGSGWGHYSQVKLKTLLLMSNFTHFLPRYQLKYDSICSFIIEKKLFGTSLSSRERRNN